MGDIESQKGEKHQIEFELALESPELKLVIYFTKTCHSRALFSERCGAKSRAAREDLESRRDWATADFDNFAGDVFAFPPCTCAAEKSNSPPNAVRALVFPSFGGESKDARWPYQCAPLLATLTGFVTTPHR